ncbi:MAG: UDP-N-acetylmuramoyl-tripeptide--D-alanyl-D-alanine ligase, partial [Halieaceae bacterium]
MKLSELEAPLSATLHGGDSSFAGVSIDSRSVAAGDLFVALAGDNFDGHDYLPQAEQAGAVAAVVSRPVTTKLPVLQVADSQRALGLIGGHNRDLFERPLVAVTGSSGKTSVKNMISEVLSRRGLTLATAGNFNNEVGVPLTLLRLEPEHQFAVVEMGAAGGGDIAWLCQLGKPTIAMVLNAMAAHLEGFGSVDDVAAAKGEIYDDLGASDIALINADQPWAAQWRERAAPARIIEFAIDSPAAIGAKNIIGRGMEGTSFTAVTPLGDIEITLSVPGRHNVANALAAIAVGVACELQLEEIAAGLASVRPVGGRLATR